MTREGRRRLICQKLARRISEVVPPGMGRWDEIWDRVAEPSDRFLDALEAFLHADTPETRRHVYAAVDELVHTWRRAGQEWEALGRPQLQSQGGNDHLVSRAVHRSHAARQA